MATTIKLFTLPLLGFFYLFCNEINNCNAQINSPLPFKPDVDFTIFHHSTDSSTLYYQVSTKSLLYIKPDSSKHFVGKYSIQCFMYSTLSKKDALDTVLLNYIDTSLTSKTSTIYDSIRMAISTGIDKLKIVFTDKNRNVSITKFIDINKQNDLHNQFFHLTRLDGKTICSTIISQATIYKLSHINKQNKKIYVSYINNDLSSVDPPYILNPEDYNKTKVDSSFILHVNSSGFTYLNLKKPGIYHIRIDTTKFEGLIISQYHEDYPEVTTANQLLYPLKYITTKSEYKKLSEAINIKLAIDEFWLDKAKSHDKARKEIQRFYSRVVYANKNFTSFKEGWKTDKGCIYIVFGEPTSIYTEDEMDVWNYGEPGNINNLKFVFFKTQNSYSTNHYLLERSGNYRNSWILSSENWE